MAKFKRKNERDSSFESKRKKPASQINKFGSPESQKTRVESERASLRRQRNEECPNQVCFISQPHDSSCNMTM